MVGSERSISFPKKGVLNISMGDCNNSRHFDKRMTFYLIILKKHMNHARNTMVNTNADGLLLKMADMGL